MMQKEREKWRSIIESELNEYSKELDVDLGDLIPTVQNPPKAELGDLAFPLFIYSKPLKNNPNALAQILKERLEAKIDLNGASLMVAGPYLNVKLDLSSLTEEPYFQNSFYGHQQSKKLNLAVPIPTNRFIWATCVTMQSDKVLPLF